MKHVYLLILLSAFTQNAFSQTDNQNAIVGHWKLQKLLYLGMAFDLNNMATTRAAFFKMSKGRDSAAIEQQCKAFFKEVGNTFFEFKKDHTYLISGFSGKNQGGNATEKGTFQFLPQTMNLKLFENGGKAAGKGLKVNVLNETTLVLADTDAKMNLILTFRK